MKGVIVVELTKEDEAILRGNYGLAKKKAMERLIQYAENYDAERLVKISSSHIAGVSVKTLSNGGIEILNKLAINQPSCCVPTTLNPTSIDFHRWNELGIPKHIVQKQNHVATLFKRMGCIPTYSCTPYYLGNSPMFGQHIAWSETSAVIYANSVLGARTVRESALTSLYASIVGRTCYFQYHQPENRLPTVSIETNLCRTDDLDFSLIGYYVGKETLANDVPLFKQLEITSLDNLKSLGASMAITGRIDLYHIRNITPEACIHNFRIPNRLIKISRSDLTKLRDDVSASPRKADFVALGCPHLSINEIANIANILKGKKVRTAIKMWLCTSRQTKLLANEMGFTKIIEKAGAQVVCDTCMVVAPVEKLGIDVAMTNSTKAAYFLKHLVNREVILGNLHQCCEVATSS